VRAASHAPLVTAAPSGSPTLITDMAKAPAGYTLTPSAVLAIARADLRVRVARRHYPRDRPYVYTHGNGVWQVSWFSKGKHQLEQIQVYVDDHDRRLPYGRSHHPTPLAPGGKPGSATTAQSAALDHVNEPRTAARTPPQTRAMLLQGLRLTISVRAGQQARTAVGQSRAVGRSGRWRGGEQHGTHQSGPDAVSRPARCAGLPKSATTILVVPQTA